ncbi:MAG: hypothetical protein ABIJ37_03090 [Pseudomonadota bacterium]
MEPKRYEYKVDEKTYIQRPLVLGQLKQLIAFLGTLELPAIDINQADVGVFLGILGDRIPHALAIVLNEDGIKLQEKNLEAMASEIESTFDLEITIKAVEDFFDCNPIVSLLNKLTLGMQNLKKSILESGLMKPVLS